MREPRCHFCGDPVRPADPTNWTQHTVWVYGPKRNGACMQGDDILAVAHDRCANLVRLGVGVEQGSLL